MKQQMKQYHHIITWKFTASWCIAFLQPLLCSSIVLTCTVSSLSLFQDCTQDPESCLRIVCNITRLVPGVNVELNIISYVDNRFYAVSQCVVDVHLGTAFFSTFSCNSINHMSQSESRIQILLQSGWMQPHVART